MLLVRSNDDPAVELLPDPVEDVEGVEECPQLALVPIEPAVCLELGIDGLRGR